MKCNCKLAFSRKRASKGKGLINNLINKLPFELHLPGYQYCGPGTNLKERLARGDPGINPLDEACKEHDIAYSKNKTVEDRREADQILINKAFKRVISKDANLGERANALLVTNIMKAKAKMGMGAINGTIKKRKKSSKSKISFKVAVQGATTALNKKKPVTVKKSIQLALQAAKKIVKDKNNFKTPRVISVPKTGGILPFLIPLFAGLSAVGALSGGAAGIAKAVIAANDAKQQFEETSRHNKTMEAIAMGRGLYLKPYKTGLGLYLHPDQKKLIKLLPKRPLNELDLNSFAKDLPHFRGVFMRNELPSKHLLPKLLFCSWDYGPRLRLGPQPSHLPK